MMSSKDRVISLFAKCSRLFAAIALKTGDSFFMELCFKESDKLLSEFINFLKEEGMARVAQRGFLRHEYVSKSDNIVQHESNVAQYYRNLISQKESILNLVSILKHLGLTDSITPLLLEKNLLMFESAIFDLNSSPKIPLAKKRDSGQAKTSKTKSKIQGPKLSELHNQILSLIKGKNGIQNLEIFAHFPNVSKRTLKRKLSELIASGTITRQTQGKKVFYSI